MKTSAQTKVSYINAIIPLQPITKTEQGTIDTALAILKRRVFASETLNNPTLTRNYLQLHFGNKEHEVFTVIYLSEGHRLIAIIDEFRGTVNEASVYPREIVKEALKHNAAAVMFAHNHPSGSGEPSESDMRITTRLVKALALVDIRVLDHFVVGNEVVSFAERNLIQCH